ncbi:MAG: 3-oxoacyl-[acyl-carrier protein] reductase [Patescibacteria group bacterium]|nr:3-oxoacyl-[acyl-carrier protein] reductase [Patescibacteria group bacterium]
MNETVLVTGGNGGLGTVICSSLLDKGYKVISIGQTGTKLKPNDNFIHLDINLTNFENSLSEISKLSFDHLVLAHAMLDSKDFLNLTLEDFIVPIKTNFLSNFVITQYAVKKWLSESKDKVKSNHTITYISTVATKGGTQTEVPYHTTKRAFEGVMLTCAREYSDDGIRSNVITPGIMDVGLGKNILKQRPDILDRLPISSPSDPKEVADLILYLINAKHVTGQNLHVNSGRYFSI